MGAGVPEALCVHLPGGARLLRRHEVIILNTSAFGDANRFPFTPAARISAAIEAATPMHIALTGAWMHCIVPMIANSAVMLPPPELT